MEANEVRCPASIEKGSRVFLDPGAVLLDSKSRGHVFQTSICKRSPSFK